MGGKKQQIKGDLDDVEALLEIISILKDVSTNKFYAFSQQKKEFSKFLEIFLLFFDLLQSVKTTCPLVHNNTPGTDIIIITSEAGFMSQLNGRVCNAAHKEYKKHPEARIVCVGTKGAAKCKQLGMEVAKIYSGGDEVSRYETALSVRDFAIERIMSGTTGKAVCIYTWPKSFNILKPRIVKLLPATELLGGEEAMEVTDDERKQIRKRKDIVLESGMDGIMKNLADIWVSSRLYEILTETKLAEAASQAQQLESAVESLGSEKKALVTSFKKAGKDELNRSMREVFSASAMAKK